MIGAVGIMNSPEDCVGEILVVEDDDLVRNVVERTLRHAGYTVHLATEGSEALAMLAEFGGSLRAVYLDLTLPNMPGEEVLTHVREQRPKLPVVLTSGHDARSIRRSVLEAATVFLPKPFRTGELLDAMQRAIAL